ncbi:MAG: ester cyclase [Bacteroidetes bacterium]|nr:ester cyclase [Bacteroidota bacterium]
MNKLVLISILIFVMIGNAKSQEPMSSEQLEANKEVALNLSKAIMAGNWEEVDSYISDGFKYEADGRPAIGKQEYIGFMKNVLSKAFSEMDMIFLHVIAEGDLVSVNYTNEMTHVGEFFGVAAAQKRIIGTGQFIREVKNGKVAAEWQTTNMKGLMQQITGK